MLANDGKRAEGQQYALVRRLFLEFLLAGGHADRLRDPGEDGLDP